MEFVAIVLGYLALRLSRNQRNDSKFKIINKTLEIFLLLVVVAPAVASPKILEKFHDNPSKFIIPAIILFLYIKEQYKSSPFFSIKAVILYFIAIIPALYLVFVIIVECNTNYIGSKIYNVPAQIALCVLGSVIYHLCFFRNVRNVNIFITFFAFLAASFLTLFQLHEIRSRQVAEDVAMVSKNLPKKLDDITIFSSFKFDGDKFISTYMLDGSVNDHNVREFADFTKFRHIQCDQFKNQIDKGMKFTSIVFYQTGKIANKTDLDQHSCGEK